MRSVELHPEAEAELVAAAGFYEELAENLGFEFLAAAERAYERLVESPESGRLGDGPGSGGPPRSRRLTGAADRW